MKLGPKQVATVSQTKDGLVKLTTMHNHDYVELRMTPLQARQLSAEINVVAFGIENQTSPVTETIQKEWPEDA